MMLIETGKTEEQPLGVNEIKDEPEIVNQLQPPTSNEISDGAVFSIQGESSPRGSMKGESTNNRKRS